MWCRWYHVLMPQAPADYRSVGAFSLALTNSLMNLYLGRMWCSWDSNGNGDFSKKL